MYREHPARPPFTILWERTANGSQARILPGGCMDLLWDGRCLLVAEPDTRAQLLTERPGVRYAGLRFAPGAGPAFFGIAAHELRDRRVRLDQLWSGPAVRRLTERVAAAEDPALTLETLALGRPARYDRLDLFGVRVAAALGGPARVAELAGVPPRALLSPT